MTTEQSKFKWLLLVSLKQEKEQQEDKTGLEEHSKRGENEKVCRPLKAKNNIAKIPIHPIFLISIIPMAFSLALKIVL